MALTPWHKGGRNLLLDLGAILRENATVPGAPDSDEGTVWVRNDSPNNLIFTDGTGAHWVLSNVVTGTTTSSTLRWDNASGKWVENTDVLADAAGNLTVSGALTAGAVTYTDTDGDADDVLVTNGSGTTSFTSLASLGFEAGVGAGTVENSILRWDGTSWVENTNVLANAAGTVTATGSGIFEGGFVTAGTGPSNDSVAGFIRTANRRGLVTSQTATHQVSWHLAVTDGTRNPRAKFFLQDDADAADRAVGIWASASSGVPSFVLMLGSNEAFRISSGGNNDITTRPLANIGADTHRFGTAYGTVANFSQDGFFGSGTGSHSVTINNSGAATQNYLTLQQSGTSTWRFRLTTAGSLLFTQAGGANRWSITVAGETTQEGNLNVTHPNATVRLGDGTAGLGGIHLRKGAANSAPFFDVRSGGTALAERTLLGRVSASSDFEVERWDGVTQEDTILSLERTTGNLAVTGTVTAGAITYTDTDGDADDLLVTDGSGVTSFKSLSDLGIEAGIEAGTSTNSTLRWDGSKWAENTTVQATATGVLTASGAGHTFGNSSLAIHSVVNIDGDTGVEKHLRFLSAGVSRARIAKTASNHIVFQVQDSGGVVERTTTYFGGSGIWQFPTEIWLNATVGNGLVIRKTDGVNREALIFRSTGDHTRWILQHNSSQHLSLLRYNASTVFQDTAFQVSSTTGTVTITNNLALTGTGAVGDGSITAAGTLTANGLTYPADADGSVGELLAKTAAGTISFQSLGDLGLGELTNDPATQITVTTATSGAGTEAARSDHVHSVATAIAVAITDSTNAEGSSTSLARADHQHAHGDRGGGTLHALATDTVAGFMSATDKAKLDGIDPGATAVSLTNDPPPNVQVQTAAAGTSVEAARADHLHNVATGTPGSIQAGDSAAEGSAITLARSDHTHEISVDPPVEISDSTNSEGIGVRFVRSDHVHAHGDRGGGSLHALATDTVAGFMSALDKGKLDGIPSDATSPQSWSEVLAEGNLTGPNSPTWNSGAEQLWLDSGSNVRVRHDYDSTGDLYRIRTFTDVGAPVGTLTLDAVSSTMVWDGKLETDTLTASGLDYPIVDGSANHVMHTNGIGTLAFAAVHSLVDFGSPIAIHDSAADAGTSNEFARADHQHPHGPRGGGTLHALATPTTAGFMSDADKAKLDGFDGSGEYLRRDGSTTLTGAWDAGAHAVTLGSTLDVASNLDAGGNGTFGPGAVSTFNTAGGVSPTFHLGVAAQNDLDAVAITAGVNNTRNTRVSLFLQDNVSGDGLWGLHLRFSSGGLQPFIIGNSSEPQQLHIHHSTNLATFAGGGTFAGNVTSGSGNPNDVVAGFIRTSNRRIHAGSETSGEQTSMHLSVNDGTRNPRAKFFLQDDSVAADRAVGIWASASSGVPPFVVMLATTEALRMTAASAIFSGTVTAGAVTYTDTDGSADHVLRTDGSGTTSFAAVGSLATFGTPVTISDSSNSAGSGTTFARHNHVHAHGDRGGGSLHALATPVTAGFMSAADKDKLDDIDPGATAVSLTNTAPPSIQVQTASAGTSTEAARGDHVHNVATGLPGSIQAGDSAAEGTMVELARRDHQHEVPSAAPVTISDSTNSAGTDSRFVRADHVHAHGDRGGGSLHALATSSIAGFMASADKAKLDGIADEAAALTSLPPEIVRVQTPAAGTSSEAARSDHEHNVSTATAIPITDSTNAEGTSVSLARADHQHGHGNRGGGSLHALATSSVAGFMAAADKSKLDGFTGDNTINDGTVTNSTLRWGGSAWVENTNLRVSTGGFLGVGGAEPSGTWAVSVGGAGGGMPSKPGGNSDYGVALRQDIDEAVLAYQIHNAGPAGRNTRVEFFMSDDEAWGHWLTWSVGGNLPYVIGVGANERFRIETGGDGRIYNRFFIADTAPTAVGTARLAVAKPGMTWGAGTGTVSTNFPNAYPEAMGSVVVGGEEVAAWTLSTQDGTRQSRAQFFLEDAPSEGGAWGHWIGWASGGSQPYVIGMGGTERFRIETNGDTFIQTGDFEVPEGQIRVGSPTHENPRLRFANNNGDDRSGIWMTTGESLMLRAVGSDRCRVDASTFRPTSDKSLNFGTSSIRWDSVYGHTADFSGPLHTFGDGDNEPGFIFARSASGQSLLRFRQSGINRFIIQVSPTNVFSLNHYDSGGVLEFQTTYAHTTGTWTFPSHGVWNSDNPIIRLGSGGGSPHIHIARTGTGHARLSFSDDPSSTAVVNSKRFIQVSSGDLRLDHYDGAAFVTALTVYNNANVEITNVLTANGLTYPADADGSVDEILTKTAAGTIGFQSLSDLGVGADIDAGSTTNSTLRWDGSKWTENTAFTATSGGTLSANGSLTFTSASPIITMGTGTGLPSIIYSKSASLGILLDLRASGSTTSDRKWLLIFDQSGDDFRLSRRNASGSHIENAFAISQSTGVFTLAQNLEWATSGKDVGSTSQRPGTIYGTTADFSGGGTFGDHVEVGVPANGYAATLRRDSTTVGHYTGLAFAVTTVTNARKAAIFFERTTTSARGDLHIAVRDSNDNNNVDLTDKVLTCYREGDVEVYNTLKANGLTYPSDASGSVNEIMTKTAGGTVGFQSLSDLGFDASPGDYATRVYVASRAQNLVTNGTGLKGTNYNFSTFDFDGTKVFAGVGSFSSTTVGNVARFSDELIPVTPTERYRLSGFFMWEGDEQPRFYYGIAGFDADGLAISASHHMRVADTTLAQPLTPGDTEIHLTTSAGWHNGATTNMRRLTVWGYRNSLGFIYDDYTYSRWTIADAWDEGGINETTHVVTLRNPFPASMGNPDDGNGTWPAGHAISNGMSGSTYKYIAASNLLTPPTFQKFEGEIQGIDLSGNNVSGTFPPGTANIKLLFLLNRNTTNPQTTWCSNLEFGRASVRVTDNVPVTVRVQSPNSGSSLEAARSDHVHNVATAGPAALVAGGSNVTGTATSLARSDHVHSVPTAAPVTIHDSNNASGSATTFSRSDHQHSHGDRGGGSLHALVTPSVAGFMSAADKDKLDGIDSGATNTPLSNTNPIQIQAGQTISPGAASEASRRDHVHTVAVGTPSALTVGGTNNGGTSVSLIRADHVHAITAGTPVAITDSTNAAGTATTFVRSDHQHAHGNRGGGTLHALATPSVAGFMSAADKDKLDGFDAGDGYVQGPASATNNAIAVYDGTTGKLIKNSDFIIDGDVATYDRSSAYLFLGSDTGGGDSGLFYEGAIWFTSFRNGGVNNADWLTIGIHSSVHDGYLEHRRMLPNNVYAHTPLRFDYSRATTVIGSMAQGHSHNGKIIGTAKGTENLPSGGTSPGPWIVIATFDTNLPNQTSGWLTVRGGARPNASSTHRRAIVATFAIGRSTGDHFNTLINSDQAGHGSFNIELNVVGSHGPNGTVNLRARNLSTSDIEVNGVMTVEWQYTDPGA